MPPFKEDLFNRIVNVGWGSALADYAIISAGSYQVNSDDEVLSTVASARIGTGINQLIIPLLNGLADLSIKNPTAGPVVLPVVDFPLWAIDYTDDLKAYNYIAFSQNIPHPDFVSFGEVLGAKTTFLLLKKSYLLARFGPLVQFGLTFEVPAGFSEEVYASLFYGTAAIFKNPGPPSGFGTVFDDPPSARPRHFPIGLGAGQFAEFIIQVEFGGDGGGAVLVPPEEFTGFFNLADYTVTNTSP